MPPAAARIADVSGAEERRQPITGPAKRRRFSASIHKFQIAPDLLGRAMEEEAALPPWAFPFSTFRVALDFLMFLAVTYNVIMTPIRIAMVKTTADARGITALGTLDILFDVLFVADTLLHFTFAYIDTESNVVVTSVHAIRQRYLHSPDFVINVIAASPMLVSVLQLGGVETSSSFLKVAHLPRLARALHYKRQFQDLKVYLERRGCIVNAAIFRMSKIIFSILLLNSIFACLYFQISCPGDVCDEQNSWVWNDSVMNSDESRSDLGDFAPSPGVAYTRSAYYMIQTLFTIGYGDSVIPVNDAEILFACFFMLFGTFAYALLIASMTSVLSNIDVLQMRFRSEMDMLSQYMEHRDVPDGLRERIKSFFDYIFLKQYGMLEERILAELPPGLFREVCKQRVQLIGKVPFWNPCFRSEQFLLDTAKALRPLTYAPTSTIIYQREKQRELSIVRSGEVQVYVKESHQPLSTLLPGDYVGDFQLIFGKLHPVGLRASAKSFCETLMLSLDALMKVLALPDHEDIRAACLDAWNTEDEGVRRTVLEYKKVLENYRKLHAATKATPDKLRDMMAETGAPRGGVVIEPDSPFHIYWDLALIATTVYTCVAVPSRIAYVSFAHQDFDLSLILDYFLEAVFIADMVLKGRYFAFRDIDSGRSASVYDPEVILQRYVRSTRFKLDVLCIVPFDVIGFGTGGWAWLRLPRMLRSIGFFFYVNDLKTHLETIKQVVVSAASMTVVKMLFAALILIHWSSVGWKLLTADEYHRALYWAFTTFTTVGYGDIAPQDVSETIFATMVGGIGAIFCAAIIANVTSFVHDVDVSNENIEHRKKALKWFMGEQMISRGLQEKVVTYFDFLEHEKAGVDENKLLDDHLPLNLQQDVRICITNELVLSCELFKDCSSGFLRMLLLMLKQRLYMSDQWVIAPGRPARGMFFVKSGMVEIIGSASQAASRVGHGSSFAEWAATSDLEENLHLARAASDCELWFLGRQQFRDLLHSFPQERDFADVMERRATVKGRRRSVARSSSVDTAAQAARMSPSAEVAPFSVNPESRRFKVWNVLVLAFQVYNIMAIPYRVAFLKGVDDLDAGVVFDFVGDVVFVLDMVLHLRFLAFREDEGYVTDPARIRRRYVLSGKFLRHVLAAVPLELPGYFMWTAGNGLLSRVQLFAALRATKLIRTMDIMGQISATEECAMEAGLRVNKNTLRVSKLMAFIFVCAHWFGCIFFLIAAAENSRGNDSWAESACILAGECADRPAARHSQYIHALYWATATVTTVGYGDISAHEGSNAEIYFSILVLIVGTLIYTICIANLEDIVTQVDVTASLFNNKQDQVGLFVATRDLPDGLKDRIDKYYSVLWIHQRGVNGRELLAYIPDHLKGDIVQEIVGCQLKKLFFVKTRSDDVAFALANLLVLEALLDGDVLFHQGEIADALFFLFHGSVKLLSEDRKTTYTTLESCVIGEGEFFGRKQQPCLAQADSPAHLFSLSKGSFEKLLRSTGLVQAFLAHAAENDEELRSQSTSSLIKKLQGNLKNAKMMKLMAMEGGAEEADFHYGPDSAMRKGWDACAMALSFFLVIFVPLGIASPTEDVGVGTTAFEIFAELFFIADVVMRMQFFARIHEGALVKDRSEFRKLYVQNELRVDAAAITPAYLVSLAVPNVANRGLLRLFQALRLFRIVDYSHSTIALLEEARGVRMSTGGLRALEMFFAVIIFTHWMACIFLFIAAEEGEEQSWLAAYGGESDERYYLQSFYWALYTATTIGYGNVAVMTNTERIFAMFVMIVGAVLCDAGITAVLASSIESKDHESATQSRRVGCAKKFMLSCQYDHALQRKTLEYFKYVDVELQGVLESEVLGDLSGPLKLSLLEVFCFGAIRDSPVFVGRPTGFIYSLLRRVEPYLAVPGEVVVDPKRDLRHLFVLQRGQAVAVDDCGDHEPVGQGYLVGNLHATALHRVSGAPDTRLTVNVVRAAGLPKTDLIGFCDPYVLVRCGVKSLRTSVKKVTRSPVWNESFRVKVRGEEEEIALELYDWNRVEEDELVGRHALSTASCDGMHELPLVSDAGDDVGKLWVQIGFERLRPDEIPRQPHVAVVARSHCHFFKIPEGAMEEVMTFYDAAHDETGAGPRGYLAGSGSRPSPATSRRRRSSGAWDADTVDALSNASLRTMLTERNSTVGGRIHSRFDFG